MNTFCNTARRAIIAAGLGVFTSGFSIDALAAPFQRYVFSPACSADLSTCTITFPVVPAGSRLNITNVSCYVQLKEDASGFASINYLQLLVKSGSSASSASTLAPVQIGRASISGGPDLISYAANHPVTVFATAGQRFQALAKVHQGTFDIGTGGSALACHISGQLVPG